MNRRRTWRVVVGVIALAVVASAAVWMSLAPRDQGDALAGASVAGDQATVEPAADAQQPRGKPALRDLSPPSGPVDDSRWAANVDALTLAAERGELAASVRLFEESYACRRYHAALAGAAARLQDQRLLEADWATASDFDDAEAALDEMQQVIESASALCAGSDAAQVDAAFQDFLLLAARQGHAQAQSCYLLEPHSVDPMNPGLEQAQIDDYLRNAPAFSDSVLQHADWPGTQLLAYRLLSAPPQPTTRLGQAPLPDPLLIWRALRLNYYRAGAEDQAYVSDLLDQVAQRFALSELDLQVAEQWAQARFDQSYAQLPALEDMQHASTCSALP